MRYAGPATIITAGTAYAATVFLTGRGDPFDGRYRWTGRTAPDPALVAAMRAGARGAELALADGPGAPVRLDGVDFWGGVRLVGVGRPPWSVPAAARICPTLPEGKAR